MKKNIKNNIDNSDTEYINNSGLIKTINNIYLQLKNPDLELYNYNNIPNIINYNEKKSIKILNSNCHMGQRKLVLSEIEYYSMLDMNKQYLVIYPGSASCEHLPIILNLFSNLKFILIDPNYHLLDSNYLYKYIYQNTDIIANDNLQIFKNHLLSTDKNKRKVHLKNRTELLKDVSFLNNTNKYNVIDMDKTKMKAIMDNFMKNSKNIIKDIVNDECRVFIIQDYMSKDLTIKIKNSYDIFNKIDLCFLSDIRTKLFYDSPIDLDLLWNYALQIIFIKILQPSYNMIKFRPPWFNKDINNTYTNNLFNEYIKDDSKNIKSHINDINNIFKMIKLDFDFVKKEYNLDLFDNYNKGNFIYFKNNFIFTQSRAPPASGETRLFIKKDNINNFIKYDNIEWENKFLFLKLVRTYSYYNIFHDIIKKNKNIHYDGCYDCYRELLILGNYLLNKKIKKENFTGKLPIDDIKNIISKNINILEDLYKLINKYVYFDLRPNYKCKIHNYLNKETDYIIFNLYNTKNIYGIKIYKNTNIITKKNIIYKYYSMANWMNNYKIDYSKNNFFLIPIKN